MRSGCLSDLEIGAFLRRELEAPGLLEVTDHLAECENCRDEVAQRQDLARARSDLARELDSLVEHIPEEQIQQYVSRRPGLPNVHEIERHLARCPQCAAEVRDLRVFASSQSVVRVFPTRRVYLAAVAAAIVLAAASFLGRGTVDIIALNDTNGRVSVTQGGALKGVGPLPQDELQVVRQALAARRLSLPSGLLELNSAPGTLMGPAEPETFHPVSPVGIMVLSSRPQLRWTPDPESASYIVTVHDINTGESFTTPPLQAQFWTVSKDLERGHIFEWQVVSSRTGGREAVAPRPPLPPAKFRVLDEPAAARLLELPPSHFIRGVLYARAGLLDDAGQELRALRDQNPGSGVVQELLRQLPR